MLDTLMHWLGYGLCHQLPERSFFAGGHQVPVCARDTGIYIGFVVSFALLAALWGKRRPSEMPPAAVIAIAAGFIGFMAWDGVSSYAGWRTTTNDIRLITGLLCGYALPVLVFPILNGQLWRRPGRGGVPSDLIETLMWLAAIPVTFVVVRWPFELIGIAYPLIVSAAVLVTFTIVNLTIVSVLPVVEGRAERLRDAWPAITAAFVLTILEVAASAWFRVVVTRLASGSR